MNIDYEFLKNEIIGNDTFFKTPYGERLITYADYTASGRTLGFIERYLISIQKFYANTHTEDSFTGKTMSALLHKAESIIKKCVGANQNNYLIPVGTGSTGAISKLSEILGLYLTPGLKYNIDQLLNQDERHNQQLLKDLFKQMTDTKPVIFISPYEHHSNYLVWQQSFAEVIEIQLNDAGEMDLNDLENHLSNPKYKDRIKIGSFSAASNITGIKTDVYTIAKMMHEHDGLVFFDFAASAPYEEINMNKDELSYFDALFISPHKFIGGPGSCGLLVIHKKLYSNTYAPTIAGGGTVDYVSPYFYEFVDDVEMREKAGTPGILQVLKASLAFDLKEHIGVDRIQEIEHHYNQLAFNILSKHPNIDILGPHTPSKRLSILSFNIRYQNLYLHPKLVTRLLNDLFGIQSRAGCACAGPYGHRLLKINKQTAIRLREVVEDGINSLKPGFIRVNFHYLMDEDEVAFILNAIQFIADYGYLFLSQYRIDLLSGAWEHYAYQPQDTITEQFGIINSIQNQEPIFKQPSVDDKKHVYQTYLNQAFQIISQLPQQVDYYFQKFSDVKYESLRWFPFILTTNP
jgi:selenocysteine lyase/cysteine desulfurase